jgi:hypothetical protein
MNLWLGFYCLFQMYDSRFNLKFIGNYFFSIHFNMIFETQRYIILNVYFLYFDS